MFLLLGKILAKKYQMKLFSSIAATAVIGGSLIATNPISAQNQFAKNCNSDYFAYESSKMIEDGAPTKYVFELLVKKYHDGTLECGRKIVAELKRRDKQRQQKIMEMIREREYASQQREAEQRRQDRARRAEAAGMFMRGMNQLGDSFMPSPSVNCTTTPDYLGGSRTTCY